MNAQRIDLVFILGNGLMSNLEHRCNKMRHIGNRIPILTASSKSSITLCRFGISASVGSCQHKKKGPERLKISAASIGVLMSYKGCGL